jgi:hypothetical protein
MTNHPLPATCDGAKGTTNHRLIADGGELPHGIVIDSSEKGGPSTYEFSVSGPLMQIDGIVDGRRVSKNFGDNISDGVASGAVYDGADGFRFAGSIEWFWVENAENVDVYLNGEERSPEELGESDDEAPTAVIDLPARTVEVDTPVALRGDESYDAVGPIVSYTWDLERIGGFDVNFAMGETPQVRLSTTGPWRVRLTVEDDEGQTDQAVKRLTVTDNDGGME